jgi:hypothetical protein
VTETDDSREIAALVAAWRQSPATSSRDLQQLISRWCTEATAHGIPVARQLEMLAVHGIHIGGGGGGSGPVFRCAYCGAYGGGGHGGLCPLGSAGIDGEQGLSGRLEGPLGPAGGTSGQQPGGRPAGRNKGDSMSEARQNLPELSRYAWEALAYLARDSGRTASEVGRGIGVTRSRAFVILRACQAHGLVAAGAKERGGFTWELTAAGGTASARHRESGPE